MFSAIDYCYNSSASTAALHRSEHLPWYLSQTDMSHLLSFQLRHQISIHPRTLKQNFLLEYIPVFAGPNLREATKHKLNRYEQNILQYNVPSDCTYCRISIQPVFK